MKQDVSELLGEGTTTAQGASVKVYRALRSLLCEKCGEQIKEGETFTRWPIAEQLVRIMPRCRACVPFELNEAGETPTHPSSLIRELLSPPSGAVDAAARPSRKDVEGAIEERLGPARRWTRRPGK
jgi:hypothetical protein